MNDRKTVLTLKSMSRKMLNRLEKFLNSPYHNSNDSITKLGSIIIKSVKNGSPLPNEIELWNAIHPNIAYDDLKFRKLNSDLLKAIQLFLGIDNFKSQQEKQILYQFEGIINQKIEPLYNSIKSQLERLSKYRLDRSAEYFYDQFKEEKLLFEMKSEFEKKSRRSDIKRDLNIVSINEHLDKFYVIEKLKSYATLLSWKKIAKLDIEIENFETIFSLISDEDRINHPVINIYQKINEILINPSNVGAYKELRILTEENKDLLPLKDIKYVYDASITYAIDRMNKGDKEFLSEVFDLYQEALGTEGFLIDGILTPTSYRNIAVIGLRLGKYEWVETFIYEFAERLEHKYRENALRFSLARLYFYKNEYERVIEELQKVDYEDVWYNINSKTMLLASYYELQEFEVLDSMINSFKVFISREKTLSKNRKKIFLNYINFLFKLSRLDSYDANKLKVLEHQIRENSDVASQSWLIDKVQEKLNNKSVRT